MAEAGTNQMLELVETRSVKINDELPVCTSVLEGAKSTRAVKSVALAILLVAKPSMPTTGTNIAVSRFPEIWKADFTATAPKFSGYFKDVPVKETECPI